VRPDGQVGGGHVEHLGIDRTPAGLVVEAWQLEGIQEVLADVDRHRPDQVSDLPLAICCW
jgi:hypothetical protein